MNRAAFTLVIGLLLAGCKSQTPTVDPFFGRTTVPPPPTGSVSAQTGDPYYRNMAPSQPPGMQPNASYNYSYNRGAATNPGYAPSYAAPGSQPSYAAGNAPTYANPGSQPSYSNAANSPAYAGSAGANQSGSSAGLNRTNPFTAPQYSGGASGLAGSQPAASAGNSGYSWQTAPQNNPSLIQPPAGYSPQTPAQPVSAPATAPGTSWPSGNRYNAPSGGYNYQGTSNSLLNSQPAASSPNRVSTPYFAGGTPNRTTIPANDASPRPAADPIGNSPAINQYATSSQNISSPQAAYNPSSVAAGTNGSASQPSNNASGMAGGANSSPTGQAPIVRTLQPQPGYRPYSQGSNYVLPASRQYATPTPAQAPSNASQPSWRESSASETGLMDDAEEPSSSVQQASHTEAKAAAE